MEINTDHSNITSLSFPSVSSFLEIEGAAQIARKVSEYELAILREYRVEERLRMIVTADGGLRNFVSAFYFVRYDFCR
ncbi:MAG: hypothetical protein ACJ76N_03515, partial [Thermoanaerobaculia bacterium]